MQLDLIGRQKVLPLEGGDDEIARVRGQPRDVADSAGARPLEIGGEMGYNDDPSLASACGGGRGAERVSRR